ncbi:MAG: hypothetical protein J7L32_05310 [Thermoplasmata archaeon]|nr:hypothetical protein [Thermoplasmata archaeon]
MTNQPLNRILILSSDNCAACDRLRIALLKLKATGRTLDYEITKDDSMKQRYHITSVPTLFVLPEDKDTPIAYLIGAPPVKSLEAFLSKYGALA